MNLYVGCSLTQAPEDFKKQVEALKARLQEKYEIAEFMGLTAGTPKDVYRRDIHECVAKCDIFIAICDFPAIGLGYELGVAVEKLNKPTLALAQENAKISRLLQGIEQPHYRFVRYQKMEEIPELVESFISNLK